MSRRPSSASALPWIGTLACLLLLVLAAWYWWRPGRPEPRLEAPEEAVAAFYSGLAALAVDERELAIDQFRRAVALAPEEPAIWANLGLAELRAGQMEGAGKDLAQAASLAPTHGEVRFFQGLLESRKGNPAEAIRHFGDVIRLNPGHLQGRYSIVKEIQRRGEEGKNDEISRLWEEMLELRPANLAILLEMARQAAETGHRQRLDRAVLGLSKQAKNWPDQAQKAFEMLEKAAGDKDVTAARVRALVLRNLLVRTYEFRRDLAEVHTPPENPGAPLERFIILATPPVETAEPDMALGFQIELFPEPAATAQNRQNSGAGAGRVTDEAGRSKTGSGGTPETPEKPSGGSREAPKQAGRPVTVSKEAS